MWWFVLIFVVLLKIPMVYLGYVIWWAIKDPPQPGESATGPAGALGGGWPGAGGTSWWKRPLPGRSPRSGPHGMPVRRRHPVPARAQQTTQQKKETV